MQNQIRYVLLFSAVLAAFASSAQEKSLLEEKNIPFVEKGGSDQQLDLYLPVLEKNYPVILFVHGGGLTSGDKKIDRLDQIGRNFAAAGIGCAMVNYRLAPKNHWPSMIRDVASAFAWVRHHIGERGGDSTAIFVAGHSSGAYLAALLATDKKYMKKNKLNLGDIKGCMAMSGMLNSSFFLKGKTEEALKELWTQAKATNAYESYFESPYDFKDADPFYHINAGMPPFLVLYGSDEEYAKLLQEQAQAFRDKSKKYNRSVEIAVIKDRQHLTVMQMMANPQDPAFLAMVQFLNSKR